MQGFDSSITDHTIAVRLLQFRHAGAHLDAEVDLVAVLTDDF